MIANTIEISNNNIHTNSTNIMPVSNIIFKAPPPLPGLQIRVRIGKLFSLFLVQNICCVYSKEPPQWDGSSEHPQKDRLNETVLLSTKNTCLNKWVRQLLNFYANKISLSGPLPPCFYELWGKQLFCSYTEVPV